MAEKQADHRMLMERKIISGDSNRSYLGLSAGFILSVMVILGGFYLIYQGHDWAGSVLIGLNLVGLAGVFVYGSNTRHVQPRELVEIVGESTTPKTE